jgi:hypothetical protein
MKIKLFLLTALLFFVPAVFAQKVLITPKKIIYKRLKPNDDSKKTFIVTYPKVKAANAVLAKKIETAISFDKNLKLELNEEIKGDIQWLEEAEYDVLYNNRGILCVDLFVTGWGAYPSSSTKTVVVDLRTGKKIGPGDVLTNFPALVARLKILQRKDIAEGIKVIKADPDFSDENTDELFKDADFTAADLDNFAVFATGVTFYYDYGFPHVIQALEPDGSYFVKWKDLKPFIKPGSQFAQFAR